MKILGIVGSLIVFVGVVMLIKPNNYTKFKDRQCLVLDKLETSGGSKYSGNFYLVLKEERGIVFDIIVSAATYSQSKIGSIVVFNLRDYDIKQTPRENAFYLFGPGILIFLGLIFLLAFAIFNLFKSIG